jgi:hypothetical protein
MRKKSATNSTNSKEIIICSAMPYSTREAPPLAVRVLAALILRMPVTCACPRSFGAVRRRTQRRTQSRLVCSSALLRQSAAKLRRGSRYDRRSNRVSISVCTHRTQHIPITLGATEPEDPPGSGRAAREAAAESQTVVGMAGMPTSRGAPLWPPSTPPERGPCLRSSSRFASFARAVSPAETILNRALAPRLRVRRVQVGRSS